MRNKVMLSIFLCDKYCYQPYFGVFVDLSKLVSSRVVKKLIQRRDDSI